MNSEGLLAGPQKVWALTTTVLKPPKGRFKIIA